MLQFLTSTAGISSIGGLVIAVLLLVMRMLDKTKAVEALIKAIVPVAYAAVLEVSKHTETTIDDRIALFLGLVNKALNGAGQAPIDEAKAVALFKAMDGSAGGKP